MGYFFKSEDEKWAKAKTQAHQRRAANGQRVSKRAKNYTDHQQLTDKNRENNARNKRLFG